MEATGISFDGVFNSSVEENGDVKTLKVEEMMGKLVCLQEANRALEDEICGLNSTHEALQNELTALDLDVYQLEDIHKQKEELCRKLQFQCEESEQDSGRHLNQNKKSEERLEQYRCEIQEYKLKQRKLRMRFENQLQQLIEQHKNLHSCFTPERLPEVLESTKNGKGQLLSAEQLKLDQLQNLNKKLEELNKLMPSKATRTKI